MKRKVVFVLLEFSLQNQNFFEDDDKYRFLEDVRRPKSSFTRNLLFLLCSKVCTLVKLICFSDHNTKKTDSTTSIEITIYLQYVLNKFN